MVLGDKDIGQLKEPLGLLPCPPDTHTCGEGLETHQDLKEKRGHSIHYPLKIGPTSFPLELKCQSQIGA